MNISKKNLQKILEIKFNNTCKTSYMMIKLMSFQGCKNGLNIHKSTDTMQHINRIKDKKSHDHLNMEKAFDRRQHPFMIKAWKDLEMKGLYLTIQWPFC
jgi:hypothetical protein